MSVRAQIAAQIKSDNPTFTVYSYPVSAPENLGSEKVWVGVYRSQLAQSPIANVLSHTLTIEVLVGSTKPEDTEDAVEGALDDVLLSLARIDGVVFNSAERTIFDDKFIGYSISAEANSVNVYRETVLAEN